MPSELITERRGTTLTLTLSDPSTRNALSAELLDAGVLAFGAAQTNDEVRAIVLRGAGENFCAGGNIKGLQERRASGPDAQRTMLDRLNRFVAALRASTKPVIASVEGAAAGAGFSIALACDLMVAASDARFVMSYAKLGLTPDAGGTWSLARALPRSLALQAIWLAEPLSAEALQVHGLVAAITPRGHAFDEALRLADKLAAMAPNAVAGAKRLVDAAVGHTLGEQLDAERTGFVDALFHANGGEGLQAFLEKRAPRFS